MNEKVSFIVTCKGRLKFLLQTIQSVLVQPNSEYVLVDYSCPENSGTVVKETYPSICVVKHSGAEMFNLSHARNIGARASTGEWLCFLDCDVILEKDFLDKSRNLMKDGFFLASQQAGSGRAGLIICNRTDYIKTGGFDENFQGWGGEDDDFKKMLSSCGAVFRAFDGSLVKHIDHDDDLRTAFYKEKNRGVSSGRAIKYITSKDYSKPRTNISICILNYNNPAYTDNLYAQIKQIVKVPATIHVVDNGSKNDLVSKHTSFRIENNARIPGGLNKCLELSKGAEFVWLLSNDIVFESTIDPCMSMVDKLLRNPTIGCIHPSLRRIPDRHFFEFMVKTDEKTGITKGHKFAEFVCPMYTKAALDANKWEFDTRFKHGWGLDYDSCFLLRQVGLDVAIDFDVVVKHFGARTDVLTGEFKDINDHKNAAMTNMYEVLAAKYGNWQQKIL